MKRPCCNSLTKVPNMKVVETWEKKTDMTEKGKGDMHGKGQSEVE